MVVKIDATMNYDEVQRELINPQFKGMVTHEKQTTHATAGKTEKEKPIQDTTVEKSYQLGSKKELFKRAHGTIERLSISVILLSDYLSASFYLSIPVKKPWHKLKDW